MPFPVDIKHVNETEAKLGLKFPPSYVVKMCKMNGGSIDVSDDTWNLHPIYDRSDKKRISRTCNDVVRETESAQEWPGFPGDAIAIAANGTGDQLVFLPSETVPNQFGHELYWWDHETGELQVVLEDFADL